MAPIWVKFEHCDLHILGSTEAKVMILFSLNSYILPLPGATFPGIFRFLLIFSTPPILPSIPMQNPLVFITIVPLQKYVNSLIFNPRILGIFSNFYLHVSILGLNGAFSKT